MSNEHLFDQIQDLVREAMLSNFKNKPNANWPYESIEDYKAKSGKKFRMTKAQKEAGLTREQAFEQFMDKMANKD